MFEFGFSSNENDGKNVTAKKVVPDVLKVSREILVHNVKDVDDCETSTIPLINGREIKYISSVDVVLKLFQQCEEDDECTILKAEENHSDLLNGIYEGGLKIWECTHDMLCAFQNEKLDFSGKTVLDLGCGTGILGIFTLLFGSSCFFQDYNDEVIEHVTIPNVKLNVGTSEKSRFFSGDWSSFLGNMNKDDVKFDVIMSSETIYNPENYQKLIEIFEELLKNDGVIYLGAKTYYFGVGGSLLDFIEKLEETQKFSHRSFWKTDGGLERQILEIKFK